MPAPVSTTKRFFFILSVFLYFKISNCLITDITLIKTGFLFHYPTSILQRLRQFPPVSFHLVAYVFPPADHNRKLYIFLREIRSKEHTSELQSRGHLVCRPLLAKK